MISPQEIRKVTFETNFRGYKPEDVDKFLERVAQEVEALQSEKDTYDQKLKILANKIEEYRDEEETLKLALINAQRMGESIIKEAKQKAETIIREANIRSEDRERAADEEVARSRNELAKMRQEIGHFKANVLNLYKQHIESLSLLQTFEEGTPAPAAPAAPAPAPYYAQPAPAPVQPEPVREEPVQYEEPAPAPVEPEVLEAEPQMQEEALLVDSPRMDVEMTEDSEPTRNFDLGPLLGMDTADFEVAVEEPAGEQDDAALPSVFDGFKGISFDE